MPRSVSDVLTISFKEILIIGALIGGLIWMRAFRNTMDRETVKFFKKLKGPKSGEGFGWRGVLVAFLVGMVCCCLGAFMIFRVWSYFQRA